MTASTTSPRLVPSARNGHRFDIRDRVRAHAVAAYFLLACALSWTYWVWMLSRGDVVRPGGAVSHFPGLFGPMIAAFVVTAVAFGGRGVADLLARTLRWRVAVRWYLLAALPFGLFLAGVGIVALTGGRVPSIDDLATYSGLPLLGLPAVVLLALLGNGFGEEVGWRGFAQPQLQRRMSLLRASIAVAAMWAVWHVPSFPIIETYRQMGPAIVPVFVFGLGSGAIVLGWLYDRSGGSVLIAALFHLGLDLGSATLAGRGMPSALATTGIVVWAALIVVSELRRTPRRAAGLSVAGAHRRSRLAALGDATVRALVRSPLHSLVGRDMVLVTYRGRTSGRIYTTPVECVRDGSSLLVMVARPDRKQWWRNVRSEPAVRVRTGGRELAAHAIVEEGAAAAADVAHYVAARPRAARHASAAGADPVVVRLVVGAGAATMEGM